MSLQLSGGVAVITGAASGIGLGLARACAGASMKLALTDISAERLAAADLPGEHIAIQHDVTDAEAWARVAERVEAELGPPLVLFNNAGVVSAPADVIDHSVEVWNWLVATNMTASFLGARTFAPGMRERGRGHIVCTTSIQGLLASPGFGVYTAAKFGLVGLCETLRAELAPHGVGVSVICPGATRTNLFPNSKSLAPAFGVTGANPRAVIEHYLTPDEVAAKALEAVRVGRFYVITHPEYRDLMDAKLAALAEAFDQPVDPGHVANIDEVEAGALAAYRGFSGR